MMMHILAYSPFLEPLDIHAFWLWLAVPLVLLITLVYKAIKISDLKQLPRQVLVVSLEVILGMLLVGAGVFLLSEAL